MINPTIKDVAKLAGVSIATVSLVIHNHKRIPQETKDKVMAAIKELNYHPSHSARGLVSRKTGNIGFVLTDDHFLRTEPFYTRIFLGSEFEARENEYYLLLTTVDSKPNKSKPLPRFILERNVDGVIVAGKVPDTFIEKLDTVDVPILFVDYLPKRKSYPSVLIDNFNGGVMATNHLIEFGHKRIAFIGGDINHPSINDRLKGYKKALKKAGLAVDDKIIIDDEDYPARENGYNAAEKLFKQNKNITAIFACNDAMAIGVMQYLRKQHIRIPEDISIIGFDDVEADVSITPPLSTIKVLKTEMGAEAMKLMAKILKENKTPTDEKLVPVELVIRKSTKRI